MSDYAVQRENMVESQVRPSDVTDRRILRAMAKLPREVFVPSKLRATAYRDADTVLSPADETGLARAMLAPRVAAKLIQLAAVEESDIVLDIGCLTGYSTAVLAELAQTVVGLESDAAMAERASALLLELSIDNAVVETGVLAEGVPSEGPYDVIMLEGAVSEVPANLLDQLKDGGRLVAIEGHERYGRACLWRRVGENFDCRVAFNAVAALLPGFERAEEFTL